MQNRLRSVFAALLAVSALLVAASCSSVATQTADTASSSTSVNSGVLDAATGAQLVQTHGYSVIDVRTPAEYSAGHVEGAENIDVTAPGFGQKVDALDRDGRYVLYCHSGSRAAAAAQIMKQMGFAHVVNAGGFEALAAAGAPTA